MEADCDDEEVVLEDSQLHKYLEEIGVSSTEYECTPRRKLTVAKEMTKKSFWQSLKLWFSPVTKPSHRIGGTNDKGVPNTNMILERQCCGHYVKLLQNSDVLTDDDAKFLSNCIPSDSQQDVSKLHLKMHLMQRIGRLIVPGVALAACLVESLFGLGASSSGLVWAVESATASGLAIYCCLEAGSICSSSWKGRQHIKNSNALKIFIKNCEVFNTIVKKAVRLIQELEIVARGFTLVLPSTPVANLELSSLPMYRVQQQCPALRMTVFHSTKDVAVAFQEATLHLLSKYDLKSSVDHQSHYLASLPLSHFGPLLSTKDDAIIDTQTDSYSLTSIKAIWQLCCLLQSEYLRRLGLCLCPELYVKEKSEGFSIFYNLASHTDSLLDALQIKTEAVIQSYQFHAAVGIKRSKLTEHSGPKKKTQHSEPKSHHLFVAVHSLTLHLQAALTRVSDMESRLETNELGVLSDSNTLYENLSQQLRSIKAELDACASCHEESSLQLDIHFGKSQGQEGHKQSPGLPLMDNKVEGHQNPIPLFELGDPIIEDQVFEAYVSSDEDDLTSSDDENLLNDVKSNLAKYNQEKENSRKMFKELKSILTVKAHEWKEREAKALRKVKLEQDAEMENRTQKPTGTDSESGQYASSAEETGTASDSDDVESAKSELESSFNGKKDPLATHVRKITPPAMISDRSSNQQEVTSSLVGRDEEECAVNTVASLDGCVSLNPEPNIGVGFVANVAAMAAARSRNFNAMAAQTIHSAEAEEFGSDTDSDDATKQEL